MLKLNVFCLHIYTFIRLFFSEVIEIFHLIQIFSSLLFFLFFFFTVYPVLSLTKAKLLLVRKHFLKYHYSLLKEGFPFKR